LELVGLWWVQGWDVSRLQVGIPALFLLSNVSTFKIPSAILFLNGLQASISENIGVFRDRVLSAADSIDPSNPHGSVFSKHRFFLKTELISHSGLLTHGWYDGLETNGGGEKSPSGSPPMVAVCDPLIEIPEFCLCFVCCSGVELTKQLFLPLQLPC
jgi:hypothetical protein